MTDESTDKTQDLVLATENGVRQALDCVQKLHSALTNVSDCQKALHEDLAERAKAGGIAVRATVENEDGTVGTESGGVK